MRIALDPQNVLGEWVDVALLLLEHHVPQLTSGLMCLQDLHPLLVTCACPDLGSTIS